MLNLQTGSLFNFFTAKELLPCILLTQCFFVFFFSLKKNVISFSLFYKLILFNFLTIIFLLIKGLYFYKNPFFFNFFYFKKIEFVFFKFFGFFFDKLSLVFLLVVYVIGFFTLVFQNTYLKDYIHKERFFVQLNFFIISMVFLVLSNNWILLLLSWEGLGISSFFLIGFFKNKTGVFKSAFKAFFFNKISDVFILLSFLVYFKLNNGVLLSDGFFFYKNYRDSSAIWLFLMFLTISAFIKSAQFFFFFWLPDSMEAPIPASALIHSATLVSAGIYLLLRFSNFFYNYAQFTNLVFVISISSMILFSLISLNQSDVKKILAFSTISNCAFIYFLISLRELNLSIFFFSLHGFFKSLCFLIFGLLIIFNDHKQDLKNWSKFNFGFNFLLNIFLLQTFFLSGFPATFSYLVKTKILTFYNFNLFCLYLTYFSLFLYSIFSYMYSFRMFFLLNKDNKGYRGECSVNLLDIKNTIVLCLVYFTFIFLYSQTIIFFFLNNSNCFFFILNFFLTPALVFTILKFYKKNLKNLCFLYATIVVLFVF